MKTKHTIGIISVLLLFLLFIPSFGCAESDPVDLSSMSLDALVTLKDRLNLAIWNSSEWKEVTVPQGVWKIGVDIPAGHWTIKPTVGNRASLLWGIELDDYKAGVRYSSSIDNLDIVDVENSSYDSSKHRSQVDWELADGTYIEVRLGSVIFTPYDGKPAFTFG